MRGMLPGVLVCVFVLSGCVSSEGTGATGVDPVGGGEPIPDAGTIEGIVVDDSTNPLDQAIVGIAGTTAQFTTDASGGFLFTNIAPGTYTVNAVRLGFTSASKQVTVEANQPTKGVLLTMSPIPTEEPYQETTGPMSGYFECHLGGGIVTACTGDIITGQAGINLENTVFTNNKRFMQYSLTSDNWETMWGEARWTPAAVGTGSGMAIYPSYSKRWDDKNTGHWWCEATGSSPIWYRQDKDPTRSVCTSGDPDDKPAPEMATNPLVVVADPGFSNDGEVPFRILYQQRFEVVVTVFYGEPAPEQFSAFPDG